MAAAGMLENPKSFRDFVLADLYRGQRLVAKVHPSPIDPQFRIASPEGDWAIAIAHSGDLDQPFQRISIRRSGRTRSGACGVRDGSVGVTR